MAEPKKRNQYEFDKRKYDHVHLQVPKGKKEEIQEIAKANNESTNAYIKNALKSRIKSDTGKDIDL